MRVPVVDVDSLSRNWWVVSLRGFAGILFGIITFIAPGISLAALVLLFGAYAFADGVLAVVTAIRRRGNDRWGMLLLEGLVGIAAALLYVIAAWALVTGAFEIAAAIRLRKVITGEWILALSGILSVALGVLLILAPGPGALAVVIWIGAYAFVFGALLFALGLRLKGLGSPRQRGQPAPGMA
jgi:uncharacterized membrane protein HdeD (DUF308 family)